MTNLSGKTALAAGASRGIGRASALALGKAGSRALVHYDRAASDADAVVDQIKSDSGRAHAVAADLTTAEGPQKLAFDVRRIVEDRLDVLVANAGVSKLALIAARSRSMSVRRISSSSSSCRPSARVAAWCFSPRRRLIRP
jgi:3-oxoacyl-[acyl-carrier protein] reductase